MDGDFSDIDFFDVLFGVFIFELGVKDLLGVVFAAVAVAVGVAVCVVAVVVAVVASVFLLGVCAVLSWGMNRICRTGSTTYQCN